MPTKGYGVWAYGDDKKNQDEEKNTWPESKWITVDYVKFLRYGQYYIDKNGSGVLAFIIHMDF